jgi:ornithine cyclodeaminase/alanine dehydrogenase-like protein (mu-crystallin family)
MTADTLPYLSAEKLEGLGITTAEVVACIEHLLRERKRSRAWGAPKPSIKTPDGRYLMATLSAADDPSFMAVKALHLNPRNPERGLAAINSVVILHAGDTGLPLAVLEGNWITAVRTAGLSVLAAKRLARPDSAVAAFVGCGVEARSHLDAFAASFPLREVRAFGRGSSNRDALCRAAEAKGLKAVASHTAQEAVSGADIVASTIPLTPKPKPFLDARWLTPGAFATMIDLAPPWFPESMTAFARIVVDDKEQEAAMPEPMVAPRLVSGDLADLVDGSIAAIPAETERSAFVFRGVGLADLALASLAYQRASARSR